MATHINNPPKASPTEDRVPKIDGEINAMPKDTEVGTQIANDDLSSTPMDFGEMNLEDAQESGYTDKSGRAVSQSKKAVKGSPTGAFTDIGAGRSSVIKHH